jgi:hypothetical protein
VEGAAPLTAGDQFRGLTSLLLLSISNASIRSRRMIFGRS